MIKSCNCEHQAQDKLYGKGQRLHNVGKAGKETRCTVCGKKTNSGAK